MGGEGRRRIATDRDGSRREGGVEGGESGGGDGVGTVGACNGGAPSPARIEVMTHLIEGMRAALRSRDMMAVQACFTALGRLLG